LIGLETGEEIGMTNAVKGHMNLWDLIKATIVCGLLAFVSYSYPVFGQVVMISLLSLVWLGYAHKTVVRLRQR
jgi:uncharacterized membrane protein YesL